MIHNDTYLTVKYCNSKEVTVKVTVKKLHNQQ